jgi:hypothetical protein
MIFSSISQAVSLLSINQVFELDSSTGNLRISPTFGVKRVKVGRSEKQIIDTITVTVRAIKPGTCFALSLDPLLAHKFTGPILLSYSTLLQTLTFKALNEIEGPTEEPIEILLTRLA